MGVVELRGEVVGRDNMAGASAMLNLNVPTTASRSMKEASRRSIRLYRDILRALPAAVREHELKYSVKESQDRLRTIFRNNGKLTNLGVVDMMVFKGYQDLEETMMLWNQRVHIERILAPEESGKFLAESRSGTKKSFLDKFL